MRKIDNFTNCYPLSKTLRFSLIPVGKTLENFETQKLLEEDEERATDYVEMKRIIDRYYREYIDRVLSAFILNNVTEYSELYYKQNKDDKDKDNLKKLEDNMRSDISKALKSDKLYSDISKAGGMIKNILPDFVENEEKEIVEKFRKFATYFTGFFKNRENMFSAEEKSTAIGYRVINENLPKFLDNAKVYKSIISNLDSEVINNLHRDFDEMYNYEDMFCVDYFSFVMSQSGIDKYNSLIGGYTLSDGTKIQGLNEYINLYNQTVDKKLRLPKLKMLYKQILSDTDGISFIPEKFENDNEVLKSINELYLGYGTLLSDLVSLFNELGDYDLNGIFLKSGKAITDISNDLTGYWGTFKDKWIESYESQNPKTSKTNIEKYEENKNKSYKNNSSFSLSLIGQYLESDIAEYFKSKVSQFADTILINYKKAEHLLTTEYTESKKLFNNGEAIELIKNLLDSIKELELFLKPLLGSGKEDDKNESFYGNFVNYFDDLSKIDRLYDKVRNYMTQKLYSNNKIRLYFDNSSFLSGWEQDYSSKGGLLFINEEKYYLAIINKKLTDSDIAFLKENSKNSNCVQVIYKFQKPDNTNTPRLFIRSKGTNYAPAVKKYSLPIEDIIDIYDKGYFKTEFRKKDPKLYEESLVKIIDYFKLGFTKHESYFAFNFKWKPSSEYKDISEFYKDVISSCYNLEFENVNFNNLVNLADNGQIYLFQIYSKDFSEHSKGKPNLHTLYFKMLFDTENLKNVVYKLNGDAKIFYRKASITEADRVIHPKNQPIQNKNPLSENKQAVFVYDLIKDKRYTEPKFLLHIPITMNFKASDIPPKAFNYNVRKEIKNCNKNYIIGIDRGERNLIYVSVIDNLGNIVEQFSLNKIMNTDYHNLLDKKEKERLNARQNWTAVENIKELKEGYISQVVHKICELVVKYDAVIAMEDLNNGFKNSRIKVEKQVYQKFEKMLIDKLNYLVADKQSPLNSNGSVLHPYQLANKFTSFKEMRAQNGFIFYVPAWLTSKIDPVTGFVNLMETRYKSVDSAKELISSFEKVVYNKAEDLFEITFDYHNLPKGSTDYKGKWTICSNSTRIETFRNPEKNNEFDNVELVLSDEYKAFFEKHGIDYETTDLKEALLSGTSANFYKEFLRLLRLTLQMRNSITGRTDVDYLISPVRSDDGSFFDSRNGIDTLPLDADANGAYNIARKALWFIEQLKNTDENDLSEVKLSISNKEWLEYAQK